MSDNYKGYPLFNDVDNVKLRAWNRLATFFNVFQDHGKSMAQAYVRQFDDIARSQINNMRQEVQDRGYGTVRQDVIKSYQLH